MVFDKFTLSEGKRMKTGSANELYIEAGKRIHELRLSKKMSREQFADKAGISDKFLYEIESGRKGISAQNLLRIANALGVSCDYILTGQWEKGTDDNMSDIVKLLKKKDVPKVSRLLSAITELI